VSLSLHLEPVELAAVTT